MKANLFLFHRAILSLILSLGLAAGLLRVGNVFCLLHETLELSDGDFGAPHPESLPNLHRPRLAFKSLARGSGRGTAFDTGGPNPLLLGAAHHKFSRWDVDHLKADAITQVELFRVTRGGFGVRGWEWARWKKKRGQQQHA